MATLTVTVPHTGRTLTPMYFITVPGGCHVVRVSGPDTLTVR